MVIHQCNTSASCAGSKSADVTSHLDSLRGEKPNFLGPVRADCSIWSTVHSRRLPQRTLDPRPYIVRKRNSGLGRNKLATPSALSVIRGYLPLPHTPVFIAVIIFARNLDFRFEKPVKAGDLTKSNYAQCRVRLESYNDG